MTKYNFALTDYLVVDVLDRSYNNRSIGLKCIPACWAEEALPPAYLFIHYPEEETFETKLQVKNKAPYKPSWPILGALLKFASESYEDACKALDFLTGRDKMDVSTSVTVKPSVEIINPEVIPSTSTSSKRSSSDENENTTINEDVLPKKKRESAIRCENNVKILIQTGQLLSNKQKVSPKKCLSLQKEFRSKTIEELISGKIENIFSKDTTESHVAKENTGATYSDNDNIYIKSGTVPPEESVLEALLKNKPYPSSPTKLHMEYLQLNENPHGTNTPLRETVVMHTRQVSVTNNPARDEESQTSASRSLSKVKLSVPESVTSNIAPDSKDTKDDSVQYTKGLQEICTYSNRRSSPNPEISVAGGLQSNVAPNSNNTKNDSVEYTKRLEEIYTVILKMKRNLSAVYIEESEVLRKAFGLVNLFVPEFKQGQLLLPSIRLTKYPGNGTKNDSVEDMKHLEDIHLAILQMKSRINAVYTEESEELRKAFASINLYVPQLKQGLSLPTIQQLKEKRLQTRGHQPSSSQGQPGGPRIAV